MTNTDNHFSNELLTYETIVQGMPEIAYVFDNEGRLLFWNKNVENRLGYTKEELFHKNILEFIAQEDRELVLNIFNGILYKDIEKPAEYHMVSKSGEKIPYIGSGTLTLISGKQYVIGQAINISKLKNIEKDLKQKIIKINHLKDLLDTENISLKKEIDHVHGHKDIVGISDSLLHALKDAEKVAPHDITVLLEGEESTGKRLFARAIHDLSKRNKNPFIKVNCAKFSKQDLEIELFGKAKDIFTKGSKKQIGKLELVDSGTIFLDHINMLPASTQSKLLHFIQTGTFKKINDTEPVEVSIRLIAASDKDLELKVQQNLFQKDLYYLLKIYPIHIPALRERKVDIPLLAKYFVSFYNNKYDKKVTKIAKNCLQQLTQYHWPGNIKELKNVIERAVINSPGKILKIDIEKSLKLTNNLKTNTLNEIEKIHILAILDRTNWRVSGSNGAALILAIHPETLRSRMRKLGIKRPLE